MRYRVSARQAQRRWGPVWEATIELPPQEGSPFTTEFRFFVARSRKLERALLKATRAAMNAYGASSVEVVIR